MCVSKFPRGGTGGAVVGSRGYGVLAAAPSIGRASAVEAPARAREAELTQALYERYSHQLYGFCFAKLGSREEAEDAVQTTFLNAFRALERGVVPQSESAWLFKIAENVCLSRHRSSFRRRRVEAPSDLELLQDVVPAREHDGDELVGLERVLGQMPQTQRRAILLREWQGLSYREIAEEMELTQPAVETLIFRARRSLAQGLEALDSDETQALRRRARRGADAGGLIASLKTFLGTTAGMKAAATVVAVGSATVVAAAPPAVRHHLSGSQQPRPKVPPVAVRNPKPVRAAASAASTVLAASRHEQVAARAPVHADARRAPASVQARRAVPAESAPAPVADVSPAPAAAPAPAAPVAPAPAAAPQSEPAPAPAPPTNGDPAPAPASQGEANVDQAVPVSTKDKKQNDGDNGRSRQKQDAQVAPPATPPAVTTASTAGTTVPSAAPTPGAVTTTAEATPPAPAAEPDSEQGQRGHDGDGKHSH
jgi:RNA polymerase sigma factor (sigma-70 family)